MAITKKNVVSIAVTRKTRTSDSAGGYTNTWAAITGSPFTTGRFARPRKPELSEIAPGDIQAIDAVLVFPSTATVAVNDKCTISSIEYIIAAIRSYNRCVQADVRAVV